MKLKKTLTSLLLLALTFISCERNDDIGNTSTVAASGSWRVSLYTDSGNDETSDFNGYTFTFNSNGTATAVKGATTSNGTWSVTDNGRKFNLDLGPNNSANKPLGELTDDWKIISSNSTTITLTDDNAASNEYLTFTKN